MKHGQAKQTLSMSRVELRYIYIDGDGSHNIDHLRQSYLELIDRLEILRTACIFHQQSLLRVVPSSFTPTIPIYEIEDAIDDFSDKLMQNDMGRPPCLGQPLLDIAIIKHKSSLKHRVTLRMSHASYDVASLTTLWTTLQSIYEGSTATVPLHISSYMSDLSTKITPETYRYWHTFLRGSSMPQIGPQSHPTSQTPFSMHTCYPHKIHICSPPSENITVAVIVKAAWALVFSQHTSRHSAVFGETISGRNSSHPRVANVIGCCVTPMPVCVRLEQDWKIVGLLPHVHD